MVGCKIHPCDLKEVATAVSTVLTTPCGGTDSCNSKIGKRHADQHIY